jgi:hypothetical protein
LGQVRWKNLGQGRVPFFLVELGELSSLSRDQELDRTANGVAAFVIGMGCVAGALLVGLLTAKTFVDWQAIQFYRAEWLLAAVAAFVAGILLKKPSGRDSE